MKHGFRNGLILGLVIAGSSLAMNWGVSASSNPLAGCGPLGRRERGELRS